MILRVQVIEEIEKEVKKILEEEMTIQRMKTWATVQSNAKVEVYENQCLLEEVWKASNISIIIYHKNLEKNNKPKHKLVGWIK